jgi:hypothetical protein
MGGPDGDVLQDLVDRFNVEHDGEITVDLTAGGPGWFDLYAKIEAAYKAQAGLPDAYITHVTEVPLFGGTAFGSMDDLIADPETGLTEDMFDPLMWEYMRGEDGHFYAVGWDIHPLLWHISLDVLEDANMTLDDAPHTQEDLLVFCDKLKNATGVDAFVTFTYSLEASSWVFASYYCEGDADAFYLNDDFTVATINDTRGMKAWNTLEEHYKRGHIPVVGASAENAEKMVNYEAGMYFSGPWQLHFWNQNPQLRMGWSPVWEGVWASGHTLHMSRFNGEARDNATWVWINWMLDHNGEWGQKAGHIPATVAGQDYPPFHADNPESEAEIETIRDWGYHFPAMTPLRPRIEEMIGTHVGYVLGGTMTAQEAADACQAGVQAILDE